VTVVFGVDPHPFGLILPDGLLYFATPIELPWLNNLEKRGWFNTRNSWGISHLRTLPWRLPMLAHLVSLLRRDEGQDIIEYGLLGAFISIVSLVTIQAIGPLIDDLYVLIQNAITP
jgi:Flp pilus assembly pilin Flp